ncbi:MAG: 6-carboxytetrahydropterin synthase QueD [bacterium]|nr:6-carboxytetrahydropterin synthase QueD [bacterium]
MYEVMVEEYFSAAHYLKGYDGKCSQLHGHNWKVQVFLTSNILDSIGMVIDFKELKELVNIVIDKLDHYCLNDLDIFAKKNPTSENIAYFIFHELAKEALPGKISKVSIWESKAVCVIYDGK